MTGFGAARVPALPDGSAHLVVEIRTVNHRFLEVRAHAPRDLTYLLGVCDAFVRKHIERGAVDLRVAAEGDALSRMEIDKERARTAYAALSALAAEITPGARVPIESIFRVPELFQPVALQSRDALASALDHGLTLALGDLRSMQEQEGDALFADLEARLTRLLALADAVEARKPDVLKDRRKKMLARLTDLLSELGANAALSEGRLEQEVALLADRFDTSEEKTRLESHIAQCRVILGSGGAVGKRLDFLLQEVAREVNTMGAKTEDVTSAHVIVDMKAEAAKMREQAQNVQ